MRLLNLPVPIVTAVLAPQMEPPQMSTAAWVAAIVGVAYVLLSYLNWIGRLPGASGGRQNGGFGADDRRQMDRLAAQMADIRDTIIREADERRALAVVSAHDAALRIAELEEKVRNQKHAPEARE